MKRLVLALSFALTLGCASVDSFNKIAADVTHEAIVQSEEHRCTVHAQPCLTDDQFKAVNVELNKVSVAGREFTKLRIAGTASTKDITTFLSVVSEETSILSKTFQTGAIGGVLAQLIKLQQQAADLIGTGS